jgi:alkaline phosphatase
VKGSRRLWVFAAMCASVLLMALPSSPVMAQAPADSAILFIGDGMGPMQVHLGRVSPGEPLQMERMAVTGLADTRSFGEKVTDSAAASTALATGHKTNNGMLGVTPDGTPVQDIAERARAMHKATGILSDDALHGATPAGFAVHVDSRGKRAEIAVQVANSGADVMMGFWKGWFLPKSAGGEREDGRDLVAELKSKGYEVVYTRDELLKAKGDKLVGFFEDGATAPSLAEMTAAAMDRLSKDPNGYFLMVEEARIDWECHEHKLPEAIGYVRALDKAVALAVERAEKQGRTLVVVTADHETGGLSPDGSFSTDGHTATPVRVFASGPGSKAFSGELDNTDIPKRIADAIGIGPFPKK